MPCRCTQLAAAHPCSGYPSLASLLRANSDYVVDGVSGSAGSPSAPAGSAPDQLRRAACSGAAVQQCSSAAAPAAAQPALGGSQYLLGVHHISSLMPNPPLTPEARRCRCAGSCGSWRPTPGRPSCWPRCCARRAPGPSCCRCWRSPPGPRCRASPSLPAASSRSTLARSCRCGLLGAAGRCRALPGAAGCRRVLGAIQLRRLGRLAAVWQAVARAGCAALASCRSRAPAAVAALACFGATHSPGCLPPTCLSLAPLRRPCRRSPGVQGRRGSCWQRLQPRTTASTCSWPGS
jgi:hypothetical protein